MLIYLLAIFSALIALVNSWYRYKEQVGQEKKKAMLIFILSLIMIVITVLVTFQQIESDQEQKLAKEHERLKEETEKEKAASFGHIDAIEDSYVPKVLFGDTYFNLVDYAFCIPELGEKIEIQKYGENLCLKVIIRNSSGNPIAVIQDTSWTLFDKEFEYNNDCNAFELVTKGDRKVFFQVELKNGVVRLAGFILNNKGKGSYICYSDHGQGTMFVLASGDSTIKKILKSSKLVPIFQYPREEYHKIRNPKAPNLYINPSLPCYDISCPPEFK